MGHDHESSIVDFSCDSHRTLFGCSCHLPSKWAVSLCFGTLCDHLVLTIFDKFTYP
jgi:hypothetical protein